MRFRITTWLAVALLAPITTWAAHTIEIRQGTTAAIPIAVVPFEADEAHRAIAQELTQILTSDLNLSARLATLSSEQTFEQNWRAPIDTAQWRELGAHYVVMGAIEPNPAQAGQFLCLYRLVDLYQTPQMRAQVKEGGLQTSVLSDGVLFERKIVLSEPNAPSLPETKKIRLLAHHLSDQVYEGVTGNRGVFSTRIAYTRLLRTPQGRRYSIEIMELNGGEVQTVVESSEPLMSPAWSPDGKKLAYVSFAQKRAGIYQLDLSNGKAQRLTHFPGINGAPAYSPDGKHLAFVLSKSGAPKLYVMDLASLTLRQLTEGLYIDTEPSWAPDGASLIFTSNRGGTPQLYRYWLEKKQTDRLTFDGNFNLRGQLTPDARSLVFLSRGEDGKEHVAIQTLGNSFRQLLSPPSGIGDESASVAPNGEWIVTANQKDSGQSNILMVSMDGQHRVHLTLREGWIQDPTWSPYLSR